MTRFRRFLSDTAGSATVEAVLMLPLLCTFYVGTFVWFDAFRVQNTNLKAAYTISDMISRETVPIDATYLNGLNTVFDYLTYSNHPTYVRITTVKCTEDCDDDSARVLEICWSWATPGRTAHTETTFASFEDKIPLMPLGDTVIFAETFMAYEPPFNVGIGPQRFENFIVTRPRFAPEVELVSGASTVSCY
jgi:hypothetical protein